MSWYWLPKETPLPTKKASKELLQHMKCRMYEGENTVTLKIGAPMEFVREAFNPELIEAELRYLTRWDEKIGTLARTAYTEGSAFSKVLGIVLTASKYYGTVYIFLPKYMYSMVHQFVEEVRTVPNIIRHGTVPSGLRFKELIENIFHDYHNWSTEKKFMKDLYEE